MAKFLLVQIHFQNLFLVLRNPSKVVGFGHLQLLHISRTLMLTLLMFWKGSNIHFSHLEELLLKKQSATQICELSLPKSTLLIYGLN